MADRPPPKGPRRPGPPAAARPSPNDPRAYRGPGFRDAPTYEYKIDYAGLPKDDDEDAALPPDPDALPSAVLTSHEMHHRRSAPRGMGGRRHDRGGTDPNAYRSPGFSEQRDPRFRGRPMTRGDIAGAAPAVEGDEPEGDGSEPPTKG